MKKLLSFMKLDRFYYSVTLHVKGRLRRRGREGDWGAAPDPSQGVAPLASLLLVSYGPRCNHIIGGEVCLNFSWPILKVEIFIEANVVHNEGVICINSEAEIYSSCFWRACGLL